MRAEMKKVAIIFHDTDSTSGATRSMMEIIDNLNSRDIYLAAIVRNKTGTLIPELKDKNIEVMYAPFWGNTFSLRSDQIHYLLKIPSYTIRSILNIINSAKLALVLKKRGFNIVYTNTRTTYIGANIKFFYKKIRHIWHIREYGVEDHDLGTFGGEKLFYKILNKYADDVVFISNSMCQKYSDHILIPKVHVIYDDVSEKYIQKRTDLLKSREFSILICGNICPKKGQDQIIKAVRKLVEFGIFTKLYVAGRVTDTNYYKEIVEYTMINRLENNVFFTGQLSFEDLMQLRKKTFITVVASYSEGFGRAAIEGMLSGHLIIGADRPATNELIKDGVTGRLYKYNDIEDLAKILLEAYKQLFPVDVVRLNGFNIATSFTKGIAAERIAELLA